MQGNDRRSLMTNVKHAKFSFRRLLMTGLFKDLKHAPTFSLEMNTHLQPA